MAGAPLHLDHNAGTAVDPRVLERFVQVESTCPGNPASLHSLGRRAAAIVEAARASIAAVLGVDEDEVTFCSGATEANNCAVLGLGDPRLPVLHSAAEHPSVVEPARCRGVVPWRLDRAARTVIEPPSTAVGLVCLVHAQSEVGTVQPVVAAATIAANLKVPLHVDAAQSLGKLPLEDLRLADSIALSPHKAGGLRGTGVLIARRRAGELRPLVRGGGQERGRRAGTVSPALAAATALAVELAVSERADRSARMVAARRAFERNLSAHGIDAECLSPEDGLPNTSMFCFAGVDGRSLLPAMDLDGIAASQGSACSSGSPQPPAVLSAMGLDATRARACVRFSFGPRDDVANGELAAARVAAVITRLQKKT